MRHLVAILLVLAITADSIVLVQADNTEDTVAITRTEISAVTLIVEHATQRAQIAEARYEALRKCVIAQEEGANVFTNCLGGI